MLSVLLRLSRNELELKKLKKHVKQIENLYESFREQSDVHLQMIGAELRQEVQTGCVTYEHYYQAFALVKEAVRRVLGMQMHDEQIMGGWVLASGMVAEMATGEGKTITSLLPVYWYALQGEGVHVITVNEYLAKRDYEQMGKVLRFLGVSVGLNLSSYNEEQKKFAYQQDVTYGVCNEFGFDYLRDHLVTDPQKKVQRPLAYAIIDEIDSILIDESRTPLIIAAKTKAAPDLYYICSRFVKSLSEGRDYEVDRETKQVMFLDPGIKKIEATFMIDNLYDLDSTTVYHYLLQSLRARVLMRRDIDYFVADQEIKIIDAFTGRILEGRNYNDGLQQAIEAKEGLPLSEENRIHATITIQKYFSLYTQIVGMTGTIKTEEAEIQRIYGLEVVSIPTHKPVIRVDHEDLYFLSKEEKFNAIVKDIKRRHACGQPVLIGTTSILQSEELARRLEMERIPFQLLNAKTEQEEAEIIAKAGEMGTITIATNMAGRGTDIRLGVGVAELGGLHVVGTERHESRRIDNQLRGRAGRQGDPGSTQFFLSLEDELIQNFAFEEVEQYKRDCRWEADGIYEKRLHQFFDRVQQKVEAQMSDIRTFNYQIDSVIHQQRQTFYQHRENVLLAESFDEQLTLLVASYLHDLIERFCPNRTLPEEWDLASLLQVYGLELEAKILATENNSNRKVSKVLLENWKRNFYRYVTSFDKKRWLTDWRFQYLSILDQCWIDHLQVLEYLKQGIHLRCYEVRDPVQAYQKDAWKLYGKMEERMKEQVYRRLLHAMQSESVAQELRRIG